MLLNVQPQSGCLPPLQEIGKERLLHAPASCLPRVLNVNTAVWQRALAVWRLLGVADPPAVALRNPKLPAVRWLVPGTHAKLAALQRLLPWQPSAADVVSQCGSYAASYSTSRVIGRLLFLQQEGTLHLLVADKAAERRDWWQQQHLHGGQQADKPAFVSLSNLATLSDAKFCSLLRWSAASLKDRAVSQVAAAASA